MASTMDFDYSPQEVNLVSTIIFMEHIKYVSKLADRFLILQNIYDTIGAVNRLKQSKRGYKIYEKQINKLYDELKNQ